MSSDKELVQEMYDIQECLLSLNKTNLQESELLINKINNDDILNFSISQAIKLFNVRPNNANLYARFLHQLIQLKEQKKDKLLEIVLSDQTEYNEIHSQYKFNDILRQLYDLGDILIDQIDFENCSIIRLKYFSDIVPYYSSFTKSVKLGKEFEITKQLIYDHYYNDTLEYYIKNDNLDKFIEIVSHPGFIIEKYETQLSCFQTIMEGLYGGPNLANFAAFYGSVNIFKYILKNAQIDKMLIDPADVISGGNAEIIHLCDQYSLFEFKESSLRYASNYMHRDILQWLNETKNVDYGIDLTEVDYLPNSSFIHYILHADNYNYNLSALVFYSIERNYPLFVIKYLFSLGAKKDDFIFYRGPPFEVEENAFDKAIEMNRFDVIEYFESLGMKPFKHSFNYKKYLKKTEKIQPIKNTKKEFTKLWHEEEFKAKGIEIKKDYLSSDAYLIRYLIDNFNFCGLQFDSKNYNKNFKKESFYFDLDKSIDYMIKNGMIDKKGLDRYDYEYNGLSYSVSFEFAWVYCEQAFDLYQKGKKEKNDKLCKIARDHIVDKMKDRMIEDDYYGKGIWKYFLSLMN